MSKTVSEAFEPASDSTGPDAPPPVTSADAYAAQILGQERGAPAPNQPGQVPDLTPVRPQPRTDTPDVQPVIDGAPNVNEQTPPPDAPKIVVGGREFTSYEAAAQHFAVAHEEATRYISSTRPGQAEEYQVEEYEQEPAAPAPRMGDPRTVDELVALADSDELAHRRRAFDFALAHQDELGEDAYDYAVNGFYSMNPSRAQVILDERSLARMRGEAAQMVAPQIERDAHVATMQGLNDLQDLIGEAELTAFAPVLTAALAQGRLLPSQGDILNPQAVSNAMRSGYESLKSQALLNDVRSGAITAEAYQQGMLQLAILGRQPAAAPAGGQPRAENGQFAAAHQVVQHAPQAGMQHLTQLQTAVGGAQNQPPRTYKDSYSEAILAADRGRG